MVQLVSRPLLQAQLEGLKAGDKKVVYLTAASGLTNEDFIFEVIIDEVRVALKEEVLLGYPVKLNVPKCEADCECYRSTEQVTKMRLLVYVQMVMAFNGVLKG